MRIKVTFVQEILLRQLRRKTPARVAHIPTVLSNKPRKAGTDYYIDVWWKYTVLCLRVPPSGSLQGRMTFAGDWFCALIPPVTWLDAVGYPLKNWSAWNGLRYVYCLRRKQNVQKSVGSTVFFFIPRSMPHKMFGYKYGLFAQEACNGEFIQNEKYEFIEL